jgi:hypothetical protein
MNQLQGEGETETARVRQIVRKLGLLADKVVNRGPRKLKWADTDEIVLTLREGEKVLLDQLADPAVPGRRRPQEHEHDEDARQRTPDVPVATGSPRSPQPEGSER